MPSEKGRAEPLAGALGRFLQQSGLEARVTQANVIHDWADIVGTGIAEVATPLAVTPDGVLFVAVKSHAWMSELSFMERDLLAAVNARTPRAPITQIRFQLAR